MTRAFCFCFTEAESEGMPVTNAELFNALLAVASIVLTVYLGMLRK